MLSFFRSSFFSEAYINGSKFLSFLPLLLRDLDLFGLYGAKSRCYYIVILMISENVTHGSDFEGKESIAREVANVDLENCMCRHRNLGVRRCMKFDISARDWGCLIMQLAGPRSQRFRGGLRAFSWGCEQRGEVGSHGAKGWFCYI